MVNSKKIGQVDSNCANCTWLGKKGRRCPGRDNSRAGTKAGFGGEKSRTPAARAGAQGPGVIAHSHRKRPCIRHSSKSSQIARSRSRAPRPKNCRPQLALIPNENASRNAESVSISLPFACLAYKIPAAPPKIIHEKVTQYVSE